MHLYHCSNWAHIKAVNNLTREQICQAVTLKPNAVMHLTSPDNNNMTTPRPADASDTHMSPSLGSTVEDNTLVQINALMQKAEVKQICWALLLFVVMIIILLEVNYVYRVSTTFSITSIRENSESNRKYCSDLYLGKYTYSFHSPVGFSTKSVT